MTLNLLAEHESTFPAAEKLVAAGEAIDQKDNDGMTALAYALQTNRVDTAKALLRLGAKPDATVGANAVPVALVPVIGGHLEAIRLMQEAGVDYSKLRYRGISARELAQQFGYDSVVEALTPKQSAL
jgi:ankyrin repeat protein